MRKKIFVSAFSTNMFNMPEPLGMFDFNAHISLEFEKMPEVDIRLWVKNGWAEWHIGHEGTAEMLSCRFGVSIKADRKPVVWPTQITSDLHEELVVVTLGKRLAEGQILTAQEVEQMPLTFWAVSCTRYQPSEPIVCFCGRKATGYSDNEGHYYCDEHMPEPPIDVPEQSIVEDDQLSIEDLGESDNVTICMDCKKTTTITASEQMEDSETGKPVGRICNDCYLKMMRLEIMD